MTSEKFKLLMINYEFPPIGGGAGKANLCLLNEFASSDLFEIDVLTSKPEPGLSIEKFADNITIYKVGIHKKDLHFWRRIEVLEWLFKAAIQRRKMLRANSYDLCHVFFGFPTGPLALPSAGKLPYIVSLRGSDVPGQNARMALEYKVLGPLFKAVWKKASQLVACSGGLRQRALRFMPNSDISVIPNGIDCERFNPSLRTVKGDKIRLLTAGRLSATKRIDMLIDAIAIMVADGIDVELTIAGGGALGDSLKRKISDEGLCDRVKMVGRIEPDKMPALYADSDIFISASFQEGMSNAMLEAMASSLAIVTTRCEGVDELIDSSGIIVEDDTAADIASAVTSLINDPGQLAKMSQRAVKIAETFSWKSVADQYFEEYRSVLALSGGD